MGRGLVSGSFIIGYIIAALEVNKTKFLGWFGWPCFSFHFPTSDVFNYTTKKNSSTYRVFFSAFLGGDAGASTART